ADLEPVAGVFEYELPEPVCLLAQRRTAAVDGMVWLGHEIPRFGFMGLGTCRQSVVDPHIVSPRCRLAVLATVIAARLARTGHSGCCLGHLRGNGVAHRRDLGVNCLDRLGLRPGRYRDDGGPF